MNMNPVTTELPSINGVVLMEPDETLNIDTLRERAYAEILRQHAVRTGLIKDHGSSCFMAPDDETQAAIDQMLERDVPTPAAGASEQRRHYEANRQQYIVNQALHARHILFAVTPGIDVQALAAKAEEVLLDLIAHRNDPGRFAVCAKENSNCPSAARGGDLGWITASDCAPELARTFFMDAAGMLPVGLHPRLVHSRYGLHIVEILAIKPGTQLAFEQVKDRVSMALQWQSRSTALRQYMMILVGQSDLRGIELDAADSPLVQG